MNRDIKHIQEQMGRIARRMDASIEAMNDPDRYSFWDEHRQTASQLATIYLALRAQADALS